MGTDEDLDQPKNKKKVKVPDQLRIKRQWSLKHNMGINEVIKEEEEIFKRQLTFSPLKPLAFFSGEITVRDIKEKITEAISEENSDDEEIPKSRICLKKMLSSTTDIPFQPVKKFNSCPFQVHFPHFK
jgi:hypothetical protein